MGDYMQFGTSWKGANSGLNSDFHRRHYMVTSPGNRVTASQISFSIEKNDGIQMVYMLLILWKKCSFSGLFEYNKNKDVL